MTNIRDSNLELALDYPHLPEETWVIWHSNDIPWPDARRRLSYLSKDKTHILKGWALFTDCHENAKTFDNKGDAWLWLKQNEDLRGHPYSVNITTVGEMKRRCGFVLD